MTGKPILDLEVGVHRTPFPCTDTLEEPSLILGKGCDPSLRKAGAAPVALGESKELGAVVHNPTLRYFYRVVNGTDTACNEVSTACIMHPMETALSKRLKERLKELGLSAREVSLRIGKSDAYVQNIIKGKSRRPGLVEANKLCDILQVDQSFFSDEYNDQDTPPPSNEKTRSDLVQFAAQLLEKLTDTDLRYYVASLERDVQRSKNKN